LAGCWVVYRTGDCAHGSVWSHGRARPALRPAQLMAWGLALLLVLFIPSMVAGMRRIRHFWLLVLGNALFGWTLVGWFVALAYAVLTTDTLGSGPYEARRRIEPHL
jgi:hypothetical protein